MLSQKCREGPRKDTVPEPEKLSLSETDKVLEACMHHKGFYSRNGVLESNTIFKPTARSKEIVASAFADILNWQIVSDSMKMKMLQEEIIHNCTQNAKYRKHQLTEHPLPL